ncbi:AAA family ATPase [Bacillus salipaludis]|uniref:AAA family ATPase n=1 Tax=Bacillus salipaludis TaxID=2547811 RepID=A0ABW8RPJ7_9BACI
MKNKIPKKIHIIGSVGSGKTTLAKRLSRKLNVPFYELDNVVWKRQKSVDIRRTDEERKEYLNSIIQSDTWIIEGVHNEDWVASSFYNAELIIYLDTKYSIRTYRIIKRFVLQKLGLEKSNYKPTIIIFFKMFKWNRHFEDVGKPNFFNKFGIYSDKLLVVANKKSIDSYSK